MLLSRINSDVVLEIFLQFVAIDWDGPFTLMLVCRKWSNLVLSQARVWTWIMVDETRTEWRERMEVSAVFSKNLPLQIVLKVPFESQVPLSHITRRCSSLFLISRDPENRYFVPRSRSWVKTIASYEHFTKYSAELKQSNDSILNFLDGVRIYDIQIRNEDHHHTSFEYSAWHVYERLNQRVSVQEAIRSAENLIITALVFKHAKNASLPWIQVLFTDLWEVLPLLSNLCYLELADNYIIVPKDITLSHIQLRSLQTLKVESPMMDSVFFSFGDDVWLGLLGLLNAITAPNLEQLSLYGPLHRIVAAMITSHDRFRLLQLNITISVFDETFDQGQLYSKSVWHGLRRCTVDIPEQNNARRLSDPQVVDALRLLFNLIPRHCSVQLHGDSILEPVMQSDLLIDVELYIITQIGYSEDIHKPLSSRCMIKSLSLTGRSPVQPARVPWILSVEELWSGVGSTIIYPNGPSMRIRVLELGPYSLLKQEVDHATSSMRRDLFSNLTDLQCDSRLAAWMIKQCKTPQLRSLTLCSGFSPSESRIYDMIEKASHRLLSLDTLDVRWNPYWRYLLPFVANFNRSRGRGISVVKLYQLPHPAILHHLGRAFKGEADPPDILADLFEYQESQMKKRYPSGCYYCAEFGWSCHGHGYCARGDIDHMVTITADMHLTQYEGDWGPDGCGWEDDLSSVDESAMDVESTETASEILVWNMLNRHSDSDQLEFWAAGSRGGPGGMGRPDYKLECVLRRRHLTQDKVLETGISF